MHQSLNTAAVVLRAMQKREELVEVISYPCPHSVRGLIQMSPDLETLFGEPATTPPPKTVINLDRARAHWKTAARARKAAEALIAADLPDLAQPHMQEAVKTAIASLQILHGVDAGAPFDREAYGPDANLAEALFGEQSPRKTFTGEASSGILGLFDQLDNLLQEDKQ